MNTLSLIFLISVPNIFIFPCDILYIPAIAFKREVFPVPLFPIIEVMPPSFIARFISFSINSFL